MKLDIKLYKNFNLREFLFSNQAERFPEIAERQYDPPAEVIENLNYLCNKILQPIRDKLELPIRITSGYRCKELNEMVKGSPRSQHMLGQAVDCILPDCYFEDEHFKKIVKIINKRLEEQCDHQIKKVLNANFYLFSYICLRLEDFDIDQLIHEYGVSPGQPGWVHIAASRGADMKRDVKIIGNYLQEKSLSLEPVAALKYCTA